MSSRNPTPTGPVRHRRARPTAPCVRRISRLALGRAGQGAPRHHRHVRGARLRARARDVAVGRARRGGARVDRLAADPASSTTRGPSSPRPGGAAPGRASPATPAGATPSSSTARGSRLKALAVRPDVEARASTAERWRISAACPAGRSVVSYHQGRDAGTRWKRIHAARRSSAAGRKPLTLVKRGGRIGVPREPALRDRRLGARPPSTWSRSTATSRASCPRRSRPNGRPTRCVPRPSPPARTPPSCARTVPTRSATPPPPARCTAATRPSTPPPTPRSPRPEAGSSPTRASPPSRSSPPEQRQLDRWGQVHGANVPYLPARQDPYDHAYRRWTATFTGNEITPPTSRVSARSTTSPSPSGTGTVRGTAAPCRCGSPTRTARPGTADADDFMLWIGLRSTWFANPVVRR